MFSPTMKKQLLSASRLDLTPVSVPGSTRTMNLTFFRELEANDMWYEYILCCERVFDCFSFFF